MKNLKSRYLLLPVFVLALASCGEAASSSSYASSSSSEATTSQASEESSSQETSAPTHTFIATEAPYYTDDERKNPVQVDTFAYGYYEDEPQIIYMDLGVGLNEIYKDVIVVEEVEGKALYTCPNGVTYLLDPEADTIEIEHYEDGELFSSRYGNSMGMIDSAVAAEIIDDSDSIVHPSQTVTLDLGAYNLDIIEEDNTVYIPFSIVSSLTFVRTYYSPVAWNGEAFYFVDNLTGALGLNYSKSAYSTAYYGGPNSKQARSDYFIEHNANLLFFTLDHFYGFLDERFAPFEEYLIENEPSIYEGLFSENIKAYNHAVDLLMNVVIGDGHTNTGTATSTFEKGSQSYPSESSERYEALTDNLRDCYARRYEAGKAHDVVRFNGNTAILSFDGFQHSGTKLSPDNLATLAKNNADSMALCLNAMKEIERHGNIENVIFDVTCNGGGDTNALLPMIGIFSRQYKTINYCPLSQAYGELDYKVDTNLDGLFDENDGYQGQYNFFILTSAFSFSCANMYPYLAKLNGIATIIGERSGGGACAVEYLCTADGRPFRISGLNRSGYADDPSRHDDGGVPVDYPLERDFFYDDVYLNNFVNGLGK